MPSPKSATAELEEKMLALWKKEKTFDHSLQNRQGKPIYSFYDGPPFANGLPHFGHSLVTSIKDAMLRYKTMRGYYVPRRNGWDCHGLPVEFAIEKEFGVSGKKQILELGIDTFNAACRDSIFKYKDEWEHLLQRMGRWSEYDNYYATVDKNYTESVWWALGEIHKQGLLYKGYKSAPYCPRCETPLSNFEVNDGYKDNVSDPSLYVLFKLRDEDASLLAWTTTPWSLPGNAAVALNPNETYVYVRFTNEAGEEQTLVLAKSRLEVLDEKDYQVIKEVTAKQLEDKTYEPLFKVKTTKPHLYRVVLADFVSTEDGSGVLHVAPAFGEEDLEIGQKFDLEVLSTVDRSGRIVGGIGLPEVEGAFFKDADRAIIAHLSKQQRVFAAETFTHTYPFCWRCETPLLYYAISSWFIAVSKVKDKLLDTAAEINWTPENIKEGRFGKWLEGARDWAVSRNRYWGAPLPIWVNENDEDDYIVVTSTSELEKLSVKHEKLEDLHRPIIDNVVIKKDGKTYTRTEEVLDCWFESGCMSFAQHHYPFENKESFKERFPADFIIEGLDQTRLWFYVQHVVNTIVFNSPAYKNVIVNGMIMAADGQKLSKRLKNYPPLEDVMDDEGADALRLFLLSSTQATQTADYMRFDRAALKDLQRNVLGTFQNSLRFFKMYADIDKWQPPKNGQVKTESKNVLDRWILSRLHETILEVTKQADDYKIARAITPVFELIDDTSNWYIRRSRRRFWKSEDDADKKQAYETLWAVLTGICQLLAPWAPFVSDYAWRELTKGTQMPESVHLADWPVAGKVDEQLINDMQRVRYYINEGLSRRAEAGIKVRQPLSEVKIVGGTSGIPRELEAIMLDELNVKRAIVEPAPALTAKTPFKEVANRPSPLEPAKVLIDTTIDEALRGEGITRELIRHVQNARKEAGLEVDNRIHLRVTTEDKAISSAVEKHAALIKTETLARTLNEGKEAKESFTTEVKIDGALVTVSLSKA